MTPEEYLQQLGLDLSVTYEDFDADAMEKALSLAHKKIQEKKEAIENFEQMKALVFALLKVLGAAAI